MNLGFAYAYASAYDLCILEPLTEFTDFIFYFCILHLRA